MTWIVELNGTRISDGVAKRFLFAQGAGLALTDDIYAEPGLLTWASPSQNIDVGKTGTVSISTDSGSLEISNAPPSVDQPGPWDALLDYVWNSKMTTLWWVPGTTMAAAVKMAWGTLEQPTGSILGGSAQPTIKFPLRDPRAALEAPFQPIKFLGTSIGATGVEGGPDMKGRPKPILYGTASNITPPRVNESLQIYMVADKPATVLCVRDGAMGLTAGTIRGTLASMVATPPSPGQYDVYAGAEGTYVRIATNLVQGITVDASEGANAAARSHAQIWNRIRTERCGTAGGAINATALAAAHAAAPGEAGFWWDDELDQKDAVNAVLVAFGAFEILELAGTWKVQRLALPSGASVIDLSVLLPGSANTAKTRNLSALQRLRPAYAPNGVPPYRVSVKWGFNYTVMGTTQFNGGAQQRLMDKFAKDWRIETAVNNAVWNPTAGTGTWPNAPELTIESGYGPGADGISGTDAATDAAAYLSMFSALRGQYQVTFVPELTDRLQPGDVVKLTHPSMGLSGGKLFRVFQAGFILGSKGAEVDLVIGLES